MNRQDLISKLALKGYVEVSNVKIERCRVDLNIKNQPLYPRDHQLEILRKRLRGCEIHDKNNEMIPLLKEWIENFENLGKESDIYFWEAEYRGKLLSGRCTVDKIIQIFPQS